MENIINKKKDQLIQLCREAGLATEGNKKELVDRLQAHHEEQFYDASNVNEMEGASAVGGTNSVGSIENESELDRLRLDLLEREVDLLKRENALLRSKEKTPAHVNQKDLEFLIPEFNGDNDNFENWAHCVTIVKTVYTVNLDTMLLIVVKKLRGRALKWFYSSSDHIQCDVDQLLIKMEVMFRQQTNTIDMKKEFEARCWKNYEKFIDYFTEKTILGNPLDIRDAEMVEYIIDGIPDLNIRNQAKMQRFQTPQDLMMSLKDVTLRPVKPENKVNFEYKSANVPKTRSNVMRCFNCNTFGHSHRACTKSKRERGSCYKCGKRDHIYKNCPEVQSTSKTIRRECTAELPDGTNVLVSELQDSSRNSTNRRWESTQ